MLAGKYIKLLLPEDDRLYKKFSKTSKEVPQMVAALAQCYRHSQENGSEEGSRYGDFVNLEKSFPKFWGGKDPIVA